MIPWTVVLLCPWDFPGKNTGVGCHSLLQRIFQTEGSKVWLFSLSIMYSEFNHTVTWIGTSLLFMTKKYSIICTDHILSWGMIFLQSVNTYYIELHSFSLIFFFKGWGFLSLPFLSFFFIPFFCPPLLTPSIRVVHLCKYAF